MFQNGRKTAASNAEETAEVATEGAEKQKNDWADRITGQCQGGDIEFNHSEKTRQLEVHLPALANSSLLEIFQKTPIDNLGDLGEGATESVKLLCSYTIPTCNEVHIKLEIGRKSREPVMLNTIHGATVKNRDVNPICYDPEFHKTQEVALDILRESFRHIRDTVPWRQSSKIKDYLWIAASIIGIAVAYINAFKPIGLPLYIIAGGITLAVAAFIIGTIYFKALHIETVRENVGAIYDQSFEIIKERRPATEYIDLIARSYVINIQRHIEMNSTRGKAMTSIAFLLALSVVVILGGIFIKGGIDLGLFKNF